MLQTRTDLELPLDPPFAALTEVHLGLVVLGHHLHKLPGQDRVLREQGQGQEPPGGKEGSGSETRPQARSSRAGTARPRAAPGGKAAWCSAGSRHGDFSETQNQSCLAGRQPGAALGAGMETSQKPRTRAAISPSKSTPGRIHLYLHRLIQNDARTPAITRAKLFTAAGRWNPPECPPTKDWIKKM